MKKRSSGDLSSNRTVVFDIFDKRPWNVSSWKCNKTTAFKFYTFDEWASKCDKENVDVTNVVKGEVP